MTNVAVVGLGKIGLPLAALYAGKGMQVTGCDINPAVVDAVNRGESPVGGEPGLAEAVRAAHDAGTLRATADTAAAVAESDVVVVMVRVGIDASGHADYHYLDTAANAIGRGLKQDTLVILESTVPVGATRSRFAKRLAAVSGLHEGDFWVAYSPERVSSGSVFRDLATYPKLMGGIDDMSGAAAVAFYRSVLDAPVTLLADAETAEFAKLAESIYRDVNIALANELARAAEQLGVSYDAAAQAGNSQPYSHLHAPGLGVGGHCIPVYPYFLTQAVDAPLIELSREINDSMAAHGVERLAAAIDGGLGGKTVLVLGLAYRGGVKEAELSSALLVAEALRHKGATVLVHDPLFAAREIAALGLTSSPLPPAGSVDAVILQAGHAEYAGLDFATLTGCRAVLDGRGFFEASKVEAAGLRYVAIGRP
ncbi:MAG TPA: nucleotide sugar dehydrogenase [Dehalococcoidia bacterium]|nr:nucleotide sugar dehydrogenase [Dehalococcoidia bacterium]